MTPAQKAFLARATRRLSGLQPDVLAAYRKALENIIATMDDAELTNAVQSGFVDHVVDTILNDTTLDQSLLPLRQQLRETVAQSFRFATFDLPRSLAVNGNLAVAFDYLAPSVVTAIRALESKTLTTLRGDIKETVRAFVENGLRNGDAPRTIARGVRGVIGMPANGEIAAENFRAALESGDLSKALGYELRDKRFDGTVGRLLGQDGKGLTPDQIDTMVAAYRRKFIDRNALTVSQTATRDAYKVGQQLSWQAAQDAGMIPDGYVLMKQWVHLDQQPNPRPEHEAMGKLPPVPADQPYANGDTYAGESDPWNCHCLDAFHMARAS